MTSCSTARDDDLLVVTIEGEGAGEASTGPDNLFLRAFQAAGGDPVGLDVHMLNAVPFARGLGSSAAAIVAGLTAGASLVGLTTGSICWRWRPSSRAIPTTSPPR